MRQDGHIEQNRRFSRAQNQESDGNKVALWKPDGTKLNGKEVGAKAAQSLYNKV